jgi:hypothetical protein
MIISGRPGSVMPDGGAGEARADRGPCTGPRLGAVEGLDAEDQKILTLARSARARTGAAEGAAVRDETGRTYAAATVAQRSLRLSALRLAVAMAVSSGATALEAAALVSEADAVDPADLAAVADLGPRAPVYHAGPDGRLRAAIEP